MNEEKDFNEIEKIPPYKRLQNLFSEGEEPQLSEKASDNIDKLLNVENVPTFWDKVKSFFKKFDSMIFQKPTKVTNRYQRRK